MKYFTTIFLLFIITANLLAQDEPDRHTKHHSFDWDDEYFDDYLWTGDSRPLIEFNYGKGELNQFNFKNSFSDVGLMELKLGYSGIDSWDYDVLDFQDNYIFGSRISDRVLSSPDTKNITTDSWRFGFADRSGYGYSLGAVSILPYYGSGFSWTSLKITDPFYRMELDKNLDSFDDPFTDMLNRYDGTLRFGQTSEAGMNIQIGQTVALGAAYEFSVVYPRHLFWKHLISYVIEKGGQGALNVFIDEVMDGSPYAGPIVSFLLKNGLSYGMFALRKENMNWPFTGESPLTYETFKINISFTF